MAHKNLVSGTVYDTTGGKTMVDGTEYSIQKGKTMVDGTEYEVGFVSYDPVFANNEWAAIIAACQNNEVPDTWAIADQKTMSINGKDYAIDIIGKNHDTYSDGGTAPLTFQMHDCYDNEYSMHEADYNIAGWLSCSMRTSYLPKLLALMPVEVQAAIREVNKKTGAGGGLQTIKTTADKLFLLSEVEWYGKTNNAASGEGSQYAYYSAGYSKAKKKKGSSAWWWNRSPSVYDMSAYSIVNASGGATALSATTTAGTAFAFCF